MTNDERHPTGLLHSADELRQLIRENPASHFSSLRVRKPIAGIIPI